MLWLFICAPPHKGAGAALETEASSRTGWLRQEPGCASSTEAGFHQYLLVERGCNASFLGQALDILMNFRICAVAHRSGFMSTRPSERLARSGSSAILRADHPPRRRDDSIAARRRAGAGPVPAGHGAGPTVSG